VSWLAKNILTEFDVTMLIPKHKETVMKTSIATFALALIFATSAIAKTERAPSTPVYPNNSMIEYNESVICGRVVLSDPDPGVRAQIRRDCAQHHSPGN
jgi:hypothetical protein